MTTERATSAGSRQRITALVVECAVVLLLALGIPRLPTSDVPAATSAFSSDRAIEYLRRVLPNDEPHPVGTVAQWDTRERLVGVLSSLGYQPRIEEHVICTAGRCARVQNVVAPSLQTATTRPRLVLVSHYDSTPTSPGGADDGIGVAVALEIARAMGSGAAQGAAVSFLFTDGEEVGSLGALAETAFVAGFDLLINVDARGSAGETLLLRSHGGAAAVDWYARGVSSPHASSFFEVVFDRMPNATDFGAFPDRGGLALDLVVMRRPLGYHTPLDRVGRLDRGSVQELGTTVLGLVRNAPSTRPSRGPVVFFDIFGVGIVRYPPWWNVIAVAMASLALGWMARRKRLSLGPSAVLPWLATFAAFGLGMALTRAHAAPWHTEERWFTAAAIACGALASFGAACLTVRMTEAEARTSWLTGALAISIALTLLEPRGSYVLLVPTTVAIVVSASTREGSLLPAAASTAVAAVLAAHPLLQVYEALGVRGLPMTALGSAFVYSFATLSRRTVLARERSLLERSVLPALALATLIVCAVVGAKRGAPSKDSPVGTQLVLRPVDETHAKWLAVGSPRRLAWTFPDHPRSSVDPGPPVQWDPDPDLSFVFPALVQRKFVAQSLDVSTSGATTSVRVPIEDGRFAFGIHWQGREADARVVIEAVFATPSHSGDWWSIRWEGAEAVRVDITRATPATQIRVVRDFTCAEERCPELPVRGESGVPRDTGDFAEVSTTL